jgi:hypothetical protein
MSRSFGFIALIVVAGVVAYLYMKNTVAVSPGDDGKAGPKATIDIVGVKNDLNAIAQAERRYWATNSKYVSIDDLRADGDISMPSNGRGAYQYTADYGENTFRITATYQGIPMAGVPHSFNINENMEIREGP